MLTLISKTRRTSALLKSSARSFQTTSSTNKSNLKKDRSIAANLHSQKDIDKDSSPSKLEIDGLDSLGRTYGGKVRLRVPRTRPEYWPHEDINELIDNYLGQPVATTKAPAQADVRKDKAVDIDDTVFAMKDINRSHDDIDYSMLFQNKSIARHLDIPVTNTSGLSTSNEPNHEVVTKEIHEMNDVDAIDKSNSDLLDQYMSGLDTGIPRTRKSRGLHKLDIKNKFSSSSLISSAPKIRFIDPEDAAKIDVFSDTPKNISETIQATQKTVSETIQATPETKIDVVPSNSKNMDDALKIVKSNDVKPVEMKFEGVHPDEPIEELKKGPTPDIKVEAQPVTEVESRTAKNKVVRKDTKPQDQSSQADHSHIVFPKESHRAEESKPEPLIFNVSIPKSTPTSESSNTDSPDVFANFSSLNDSDKAKKIENILNFVSKELPSLSSDSSTQSKFEREIQENLQRLNELKIKISKIDKLEETSASESILSKDLETEKLQNFLRNANETRKREDEQEFRELRAYEWSKIMNDKNAHTFKKHNFFSPIDEKLLKKTVNNALNPNYNNFESHDNVEALFPKYENQSKIKKAYLTLNSNDLSSPVIESNVNPFGSSYRPPALLQLIRELSEDSNYKDLVTKIDQLSLQSWKLIGIGHDSTLRNKVLVFEKIIDEKVESRTKRLKFIKVILGTSLGLSIALSLLGVLTGSEVAQHSVDENKNIQKIK